MPLPRRFLAGIGVVLLIAGCATVDTTSPPVTVAAGTYLMTKVNGFALPANVSDDKSPVWINSGSLTIEPSGSFKSEVAYTRIVGESLIPTSETCSGTYTRNSKGLVFSAPVVCNGPTSATVDGETLIALVNPSIRVEYKL